MLFLSALRWKYSNSVVLSLLVLLIQAVPRCCECQYHKTKEYGASLNVGVYESVFYLNQDQLCGYFALLL